MITVCISYKKYKTEQMIKTVVKALKIPFEIILDVIINCFLDYKYRKNAIAV